MTPPLDVMATLKTNLGWYAWTRQGGQTLYSCRSCHEPCGPSADADSPAEWDTRPAPWPNEKAAAHWCAGTEEVCRERAARVLCVPRAQVDALDLVVLAEVLTALYDEERREKHTRSLARARSLTNAK